MRLEYVVVAAFVLYAVVYLGRYAWRVFSGKKTGCGCGSEGGCPRGQAPEPKVSRPRQR